MDRALFLDAGRDARRLARVLAAIAAFALASGWFVQYGLGYPPCSLCILQRLAFFAVFVTVLPLAFATPRAGVQRLFALAVLCAVLGGVGVAGYQVWLNAFPTGVARCGRGVAAYFDDTVFESVAGWLLDAPGDCGKPPRFLDVVTMPQLGLVTFLALLLASSQLLRAAFADRRSALSRH